MHPSVRLSRQERASPLRTLRTIQISQMCPHIVFTLTCGHRSCKITSYCSNSRPHRGTGGVSRSARIPCTGTGYLPSNNARDIDLRYCCSEGCCERVNAPLRARVAEIEADKSSLLVQVGGMAPTDVRRDRVWEEWTALHEQLTFALRAIHSHSACRLLYQDFVERSPS